MNLATAQRRHTPRRFRTLSAALFVCAALAAGLIAAVFAALPRGFDLTDEGFYLNNILSPSLYPRLSQFGFVLNPVFEFLGRDIILFRYFGFLLLILFSLPVFFKILRLFEDEIGNFSSLKFIACALTFGSASILFYSLWLPTAGYNDLNIYGASLVAAGIIPRSGLALPAGRSAKAIGPLISDSALVAVGLALCFLAKPTTAAVLAVLVLVAGAAMGRLSSVMLAGGIAGALVLGALLAIDSSPIAVFEQYARALDLKNVIKDGHELSSLLAIPLNVADKSKLFFLYVAVGFSLILTVLVGLEAWWSKSIGGSIFALMAMSIASAIWLYNVDSSSGFVTLTIPLFAVTCVVWLLATLRYRTDEQPNWRLLGIACIVMLIPIAVGFGSNSHILKSAGRAGVFWVAGTLMFIAALTRGALAHNFIVAIALVSSLATLRVVVDGYLNPYRLLAPLWAQTEWVSIRDDRHWIRVDPTTATYLRTLREAAKSHGFTGGTPIIDLTGMSPGTVYALGGTPIGAAWLFGGYPRSWDFAMQALARVPRAELERAWVLSAPDGHRHIDTSVLGRLGLSFPRGYSEIVQIKTGYADELHVLWKPAP